MSVHIIKGLNRIQACSQIRKMWFEDTSVKVQTNFHQHRLSQYPQKAFLKDEKKTYSGAAVSDIAEV